MKGGFPRILVLRGGAIGDFILTLPVLQALRDQWPNAFIELVGYTHVARLAEAGGLADKVRSLDEAGIARFFIPEVRLEPDVRDWISSFALTFNFLHDLDGVVCANLKAAGSPQVLYRSPLVEEKHAADHLAVILEDLAMYIQPAMPRLLLDATTRERGRDRRQTSDIAAPYAVIHPGSGNPRKNWPTERFLNLAKMLRTKHNITPLFIAGEADEEPIGVIEADHHSWALINDMDLPECAAVLADAVIYVGNDSGISHLAAAVGTPSVVLMSSGRTATWAPRGDHVSMIKTADGLEDMQTIDEDRVWKAAEERLSKIGKD